MRCFGASSTNSRRCRAPRRSPQGGSLTLQFLPLAKVPAARKKCRDWRREQGALGCRLPIRHVATRRLCRLFYLPLTILFPQKNYIKVHLAQIVILQFVLKFYPYTKLQENLYVTHVVGTLVSFYSYFSLFNWVLCENVHDILIPQNDV